MTSFPLKSWLDEWIGCYYFCYKISDKNAIEEGRVLLDWHLESIFCHGGKGRQEHEVAGHIVSEVRKQEGTNSDLQVTFSFLYSPVSRPWNDQDKSLHLNEPLLETPSQTCSQVCLLGASRCHKLTRDFNHHNGDTNSWYESIAFSDLWDQGATLRVKDQ